MTTSGQHSRTGNRRWANVGKTPPARRPGFTLVEIAVVFAVISILVVVVAWAARGIMADSKAKETKAIMNNFVAAMAEYKGTTGRDVPGPPRDLAALPQNPPVLPAVFAVGPPGRIDFYRRVSNPSKEANDTDCYDGVYGSTDMTNLPPKGNDTRIYGTQALYYALDSEPSSKAILSKISSKYWGKSSEIWAAANGGDFLTVRIGGSFGRPKECPVLLDAWGQSMYYGLDRNANNGKPFLQSPGKDGVFGNFGADGLWGTADDQPGDDILSFKGD